MKSICQGIVLLAASAGLVACGGSSSPGETGLLSLGVSDHPIHEIEKVCIAFNAIELKPVGDGPAQRINLPETTTVNLLDFQGMNAFPLLHEEEVDAGDYAWMRLIIDATEGSNGGAGDTDDPSVCDGEASYIVSDGGTRHNLFIPSFDQTGLKLSGFTVPANGSVNFTVEWDLMRSITEPPSLHPDVILTPHIKLVDNSEVGALSGSVSERLVTSVESCTPAVYVFDNATAEESDIVAGEDVASAIVSPIDENDATLGYGYEIGHLLVGSYEAAFSCDDGATFTDLVEGNPFDINVGKVTERNFEQEETTTM